MKIAVVSDFDGTLTKKDVGDAILLKWGKLTIQEIERSYQMGVKVEDWMRIYFPRIADVKKEEIERFIHDEVEARDGFVKMISFLNINSIPFEIVSGGVDLYIEPFMRKYGVSVKGFYGVFKDGRVEYPFLDGMTLSQFKASRVCHYRSLGYNVVFLGDSQNDYEAIICADVRFATLRLSEILKMEKRDFFHYESLEDVIRIIDETLSF